MPRTPETHAETVVLDADGRFGNPESPGVERPLAGGSSTSIPPPAEHGSGKPSGSGPRDQAWARLSTGYRV